MTFEQVCVRHRECSEKRKREKLLQKCIPSPTFAQKPQFSLLVGLLRPSLPLIFFPLELCKNERVGLFAFALSLRFCRLAAVSREDSDRRRRSGGGKLQSRHLGVRENQNGVRSLRAHWRTLSLSLFIRSRPQPSMQKKKLYFIHIVATSYDALPGQRTDIFMLGA